MKRENRTGADTFLEGLCMLRELVYILFVISAVLFVLSLVSLAIVEPGSGTYVIVVVNLVGLSVFLLASGAVLYACRDRY